MECNPVGLTLEQGMENGLFQADRYRRRVGKIQVLPGLVSQPIAAFEWRYGETGSSGARLILSQVTGNGIPGLFRANVRERDSYPSARDAVEVAGRGGGSRFIVAPNCRLRGNFRTFGQETDPLPFFKTVRNVIACLVQGGLGLIRNSLRDPDWWFTSRKTEPSRPRCRVELIDALLRFGKQDEIIVEGAQDDAVGWPKGDRPSFRRTIWRRTPVHCRLAIARFNSFQLLRAMASPKLSRFLYVRLRCSAIWRA